MHMASPELDSIRPFRRDEYNQMARVGLFAGERVELLRGMVVEMSPQGNRHVVATMRLTKLFILGLGDRAEVRAQFPLAASDISEPEPDLALTVPRTGRELDHPETALLVVEVSDTSLRKDRDIKGPLYAEVGIPEYWIIDLQNDCILRHLEPVDGTYSQVETLIRGETIAPSAYPDVALAVHDILPPI